MVDPGYSGINYKSQDRGNQVVNYDHREGGDLKTIKRFEYDENAGGGKYAEY
jgi:hypothetical protein